MNIKKLTMGGLFTALGALFPQLFHIIGGQAAGTIFLPMHIPVLLAGFFAGWEVGLAVGLLSPVVSFLITGGTMPPVPVLYFMLFELAGYGLLAGLFYKKFKINIYISLVLSMLGGRIIRGGVVALCIYILKISLPPYITAFGSLIAGVPGMILQIAVIPLLILLINRRFNYEGN